MEKWQENRNYRKIRDENGTVIANIITVDGRDVAVTEDVFAAYAQMDRRERYLSEDLPTGKVLSMEQLAEDGVLPDYVGAETAPSAEDCVLARESEREREELTSLLLAALIALEDRDRQLITALFYDRLSTREYARRQSYSKMSWSWTDPAISSPTKPPARIFPACSPRATCAPRRCGRWSPPYRTARLLSTTRRNIWRRTGKGDCLENIQG